MFFQGVRNILKFNWPFYAAASVTAVGSAFFFPHALAVTAFFVATYFALASLIVSHVVYDGATLRSWRWLAQAIGDTKAVLNLHAGFDDTTDSLRHAVSGSVHSLSFYDSAKNTEPSIARAQSRSSATRFAAGSLPCLHASCDAILLIFAAHEIRIAQERDRFIADAAQALRKQGRIVIVEHLRNVRTVAVFGPGALHFYSRREWLRVAKSARLTLLSEEDLTPFAHYFVFGRTETS